MLPGGALNVGNAAGLTVIVRVFVIVLLKSSVNVHVSVIVPPHAPAGDWALNVDVTDPLISQEPDPPLL
jgi:hypothetical protein